MERKTLLAKLEMLKPALSRKEYIPVLTHYAFKDGKIVAHNDVIAIETEFDTGLNACVRGKELIELLKKSKTNEIELVQRDDAIHFKSGKSKAKLPSLSIEKFYFEFPETGDQSFELDGDFFSGLKSALNSTSTEVQQRAMNGVTLQGDYIYSTDNVVITEYELSNVRFKDEEENSKSLILPLEFCRTISGINAKYEETPSLSLSHDFAIAEFSFCRVFTKLVDAEPLNFSEMVEQQVSNVKSFTNLPENFSDAISRAALFVGDEGYCEIETKSNKLFLKSSSSFSGDFEEECEIDPIGEFSIRTNPYLLSRVLGDATSIAITDFCIILEGNSVTHLVANQ